MMNAYRTMLTNATRDEVSLQVLKLLRARFGHLKQTQGRGEFKPDDVREAEEVLDFAIARRKDRDHG